MPSNDCDFDQAPLEDMRGCMEPMAFSRLLQLCTHELGEQLAAISTAHSAGNPRFVKSIAHKLCGLASQFGLSALSTQCRLLETSADFDLSPLVSAVLRDGQSSLSKMERVAASYTQQSDQADLSDAAGHREFVEFPLESSQQAAAMSYRSGW